jgi:hypothetical protein
MFAKFLGQVLSCMSRRHSLVKLMEYRMEDCALYMQCELQQYLRLRIQKRLHKQRLTHHQWQHLGIFYLYIVDVKDELGES